MTTTLRIEKMKKIEKGRGRFFEEFFFLIFNFTYFIWFYFFIMRGWRDIKKGRGGGYHTKEEMGGRLKRRIRREEEFWG